MKKLTIFFTLVSMAFSLNLRADLDSVHVDAFMDGLVTSTLNDKNIAGATACIVKDGEVLLLKGYGYSDLEERKPVIPEKTLFRIGSVSKLFVWVAVMQLVEQGQLDLDRNINDYLVDIEIPDTFEEPITMTHLMSHTPGFEDIVTGLFSEKLAMRPLDEVLKRQLPARVRPPGVHAAYSNHGTAIAAHIVELISGIDWNQYVEENILHQLGMNNTTFRQPLPDDFTENMSKGYKYEGGELVEKPFEFVSVPPAGSTTTTAEDMANFMRMFLQNGHFNETVILDSATYDKMLRPVLYHAPMVNPCRYGFMDISHKCQKIIGHGGNTFWFHSLMALFPDHNLGLFISFNSEGGGISYIDVLDAFVEQYYYAEQELNPAIDISDKYLEKFTGKYKVNRYPHKDYTKIISLISQVDVSAKEGMLRSNFMGETNYWLPIDSLIFREKNSCEILAFEKDKKGNIAHGFLGRWPIMAFDKVPFYESQPLNLTIMVLAILFSIVTLVFWPVVFFTRRNYKPLRKAPETLPFGTKFTAWIAALILICFYIFLSIILGDAEKVVYTAPPAPGMIFVLLLPFIFIILTIIMLYNTFKLFSMKKIRIRSRLYYTLLVIINIFAIAQMYYWNFIGFKYY